METIFNNPGFQLLLEKIFLTLNYEDLKVCRQINRSSKQILDNPMFWLKKFIPRGISKKNQKDWTKSIQLLKNTYLEKIILLYLKKCSKNPRVFDIPCYINEDIIFDVRKVALALAKKFGTSITKRFWRQWKYHEMDFLKILAQLTIENGVTSVLMATVDANAEMVQVLAPLLASPNTANQNGVSPIIYAIIEGHVEIVRILAPLIDNPNAFSKRGTTSIELAILQGHTEIVKILALLVDNPNTPNIDGVTPIEIAVLKGCTESVRILAPLSHNLNVPNKNGRTPLELAVVQGCSESAKILAPLSHDLNNKQLNI